MENGTIFHGYDVIPGVLCNELYSAEIQKENQTGKIGFYSSNFDANYQWVCPDTKNITILNNVKSHGKNSYNQSIVFRAEVYPCE